MPYQSPTPEEQLAITVPDTRVGRNGAGSDPGPGGRPGSGAARAPAGRAALPRAAGFWLVAVVLFLLLLPVVAASPLYRVYQAEWRFSATTLTVVFGVYALTLLATLLVFGSLSDYLGRRRVIAVALAASAGACGLFLAAHGVGLLFAARALQGAAVGAAVGALGAALIDLQPEGSGRAPVVSSAAVQVSFAIGGLSTSALVQYAPTAEVYSAALAVLAAAAAGIFLFLRRSLPRGSAHRRWSTGRKFVDGPFLPTPKPSGHASWSRRRYPHRMPGPLRPAMWAVSLMRRVVIPPRRAAPVAPARP